MIRPRNPWLLLFAAFLPFFANALLYIGLPPLLDAMAETIPMSHAGRGALMGVVSLATLALVLVGGRLVDRRGGRYAGIAACLCTIPGGLLSAAPIYEVVLAGRALVGAGGLLSMVVASRAVGRIFPEGRRAVPMGFFHAVFPTAAVISFAWFRSLGGHLGWQIVVLGTAGVAALAMLLFVALYREEAPAAGDGDGLSLRDGLRMPWRFWILTALWLVYGITGGTVNTFGAAYLAATGLDPVRADGVIMWSMMGVIPATPLLGAMVDRWGGLHPLLTACGLISGVVLGLLVARVGPPEPLGILFGAILAGVPLAVFLFLPLWVSPHRTGLSFALLQGAMSIGALVGPVGSGFLRDLTGSHVAGMSCAVVLLTMTGVLGGVLWFLRARQDSRRTA
ncbi:MAG: MFS transporter [Pseudomonadota bacterium]